MINKLTIKNFRSIQNFEMNNMKRITLVSGRNNSGKSTILEALFLLMDHYSPDSFNFLNTTRGMNAGGASYLWEPLFHNMDLQKMIEIRIDEDGRKSELIYQKDDHYLPDNISGISDETMIQFRSFTRNSYSLKFHFRRDQYEEDGHYLLNGTNILREVKTSLAGNEILMITPTRYLNAQFSRFSGVLVNEIGRIELSGKKGKVIDVLKLLDPSIEDIVTLSTQGTAQLYIKINHQSQLVPLQYAGDGIIVLLNICLAMMQNENGLVLIDELESGFHYSAYADLWRIIDQISQKYNCQVIATTHSYELISNIEDHIHSENDFTYYRIEKKSDETKAFRFEYDELIEALHSEMEVR